MVMIGLGRLGLSISLCFEQAGWDVLGMDISKNRVDAVNERELKSREPMVEEMLRKSKNLRATINLEEALQHGNIVYISVATPSVATTNLNVESLSSVLAQMKEKNVKNKHLVIVSTIMPGYIQEVARYLLEGCENVTISYIPDGAVPISYGRLIYGITNPEMVLIGEDSKEAGDVLEAAHLTLVANDPTIFRMNTTSAEMTKLALSAMSACKIAMSNFIADLADAKHGADADTNIARNGSDSRFGPSFLARGYGFGGPCIPRDTRATAECARNLGIDPILVNGVLKSNEEHIELIAERLLRNRRDLQEKIIVDDVSFKQNSLTDVIEESRKLDLANLLVRKGAHVVIRDKLPIIKLVKNLYGKRFDYEVVSHNAPSDNVDRSPRKRQRAAYSNGNKVIPV